MQEWLNLLFWIGTAAGGLLILLLLLSIFSGLEIGGDADLHTDAHIDGHADGDVSDGSLGIIKTLLTFISVGAFTARAISLNTSWSWPLVIISGLLAGFIAAVLLSWFFRWLLRNQEEGNWYLWQAEGKMGKVHVPIPPGGKGRIFVQIDDATRELAAASQQAELIGTHEEVLVVEAKEDHVIVAPLKKYKQVR